MLPFVTNCSQPCICVAPRTPGAVHHPHIRSEISSAHIRRRVPASTCIIRHRTPGHHWHSAILRARRGPVIASHRQRTCIKTSATHYCRHEHRQLRPQLLRWKTQHGNYVLCMRYDFDRLRGCLLPVTIERSLRRRLHFLLGQQASPYTRQRNYIGNFNHHPVRRSIRGRSRVRRSFHRRPTCVRILVLHYCNLSFQLTVLW